MRNITRAVNGFVATEPFVNRDIKVAVNDMVGFIDQKETLTPLKVIFGNAYLTKTIHIDDKDTIFVSGESFNHTWARKIFKLDDKDFILVPIDQIKLIRTPHYELAVEQSNEGLSNLVTRVNLDEPFLTKNHVGIPQEILSENINSR